MRDPASGSGASGAPLRPIPLYLGRHPLGFRPGLETFPRWQNAPDRSAAEKHGLVRPAGVGQPQNQR